jgi:5-methylcytosine-specific restriction endonuclease McrA
VEIPQRSSGSVDQAYFPAKAELEKHRRPGFCMICQLPLVKDEKNSGRKYHHDCWDRWFAQFRPPMLWADFRERALKRDHHTCVICGLKAGTTRPDGFHVSFSEFVVDHIKPIALGGPEFDMANLQTL